MKPKDKAKELINKMLNQQSHTEELYDAKQCALIAVDELIKCTPSVNMYPPNFQTIHPRVKEYWQEVKQEIEKL